MVAHSLTGAHSDSGSQVLWDDGERVFRRGWRLEDNGNRRAVLIVVPAAEHPARSSLDHLTHEYELKDQLDGAWAARPLDLVRDAGRTVLVLEDVDGEPLDRLLGVPMEAGRFLGLAIAITAAVGKLHQRSLVHKDIKPANILVNGATDEVRLTGFGIASRLSRERQPPHPPETIAGTLAYMAPEQTGRMNRSIDSRSDLYALGVTLYQMLTGALPFTAAEPMEWVHCHLARRPVPPAERLKQIPAALSAIVMKLLAKTAEDRYQTAAGIESDLRRCQAEWEAQRRISDLPLGEHDTPDRLLIPEKLYGRAREVETLLAAFDRVVHGGAPELVLVSGYSGIGKSSVVNELQPVLVPPRGLFAAGKFDQYKRDIPYSTLAQAFQSLIRPLLGKSEAELARWRDALREVLGQNAGLIANLVPEVKLIIGEPPSVPELPPQDAQRRFQMVFRQFIGVFARPEHPLALFLDDLQWLDAATLDLLEDLLSQSDLRNLLLVGAYRDNEVTAAHPLMRKLEAIQAIGRVQEIKLNPLTTEDLHEIVADSLRCDLEQAAPLAELVYEKTDGNPFFVIQFLHVLGDEGLLAFDHERARWFWDLSGIRAKGYTDNVVELLAAKLTRLMPDALNALRQLACVGNVAEISILSIVLQTPEEEVRAVLWEALRQQLIERLDRSYKFVHDRVQEAAYALIPQESRAEAHLTIGRLLVAHTPPEKRDEAIFEIVNQLNRGVELVSDRDELDRIAELNAKAGQRAKAATAYVTALALLRTGAAVLGEAGWQRSRALAFTLAFEQAECEFLMGDLEQAEAHLLALVPRADGPRELAAVACLRIMLYVTRGEPARSVEVCLKYLENEGIHFTPHPSREDVESELERMWRALGGRSIEDLAQLPETSDAATLATLDVLAAVASPAWFTDQLLPALIGARIANVSIECGNGPASSFGYAMLGMKLGPFSGDYRTAYRFGKLALALAERGGNPRTLARVLFGYTMFTRPWADDLSGCRELLERGFEAAERAGDVTYATYLLYSVEDLMLIAGSPLEETEAACWRALSYARKLNFDFAVLTIQPQLALTRMLRGDSVRFGSFDGPEFDQDAFERICSGVPALTSPLCRYWFRRQQAHFLAGDAKGSIAAAEAAEPLLWCADVYVQYAEYHFYGALARAQCLDQADAAARPNLRERLEAHVTKLAQFGENSPVTLGSRAALAAAEFARIEGRERDAMTLYERAIGSARAAGFVHIEALSFELAARFYAARGFETIASSQRREARAAYLRWGAHGKVRQLDQLYPQLKQDEHAPGPLGTIDAPVEQLDLATVIGVSQALSGEMDLEKLIDKLMRAAIWHTGANRGLLICPRSDELLIYAEATAHGEDVATHVRERDASGAGTLPESLVRYILRTGEIVVLDDASSQNSFSADPYIIQRRARSILCLPMINQGRLVGILYFENNLAPHVFTPDRLTVLKVLATQGAISLENIGLYRALADREAKIRRLVDANVLGICIWNLEGAIVEANEAFLHMLQYGREDVVSGRLRWTDLTPDELREQDERAVTELRSTGTFQPFEKEFFRKDGSRVPVLIGGALFEESRNEGVAFVLDLTERKRGEAALKQSETRYQNLFQAMAVSFFELDYTSSRQILRALRDAGVHDFRSHFKENPRLIREFMRATRVVDVNDRTVALFGRGNKEELLTSVEAFWPEESLDDYVEAVLATIERNNEFSIETRVRRLDGTVFDARFTLRYATEDKTRGLAGVIDITERKRAEEALRESERNLRSAIDGIAGLVAVMAPNGELETVNRQVIEYFGRSAEELKNWGTSDAVHPEDLPGILEQFKRSIAAGTPFHHELRLRRIDGEYRWFENRGTPIRDDSGRILRWYTLLTDIEDRTQALARLQQMQSDFAHMNRVSVMGELAASLSHEITQPIASARNNARAALNFLDKQSPDLGEAREALGCVVGDADRAGDIVDRIREHIKKAPPRKERFDLNAAISEVITLARSAIIRNGVSVQARLADGLSPVHGDRVQLQQVVMNLILNAVEAMGSVEPGARELSISTEHDHTGVLVAVRDSGPGIDPTLRDRVFEAFYTTKSNGTGMGLSICRSIIDAHGGRLWADANEPRGAVFQFNLPGVQVAS